MGHEINSGPKPAESQGDTLRMAEFYANIALSDVFQNGAAITSQGALVFPFLDSRGLDPENKELFNNGMITKVRPDEIYVDVKSPATPPVIFLIPPKSLERLAFQEHFTRGRQRQSSAMLYHGLDENNRPITDWLTNNFALMQGLKNIASANVKRHGLNPATDPGIPLKTLTKNALFDMAVEFGVGNLKEVVQKTAEQHHSEEQEIVAEVEQYLNGNHDK